MARTWNEDRAGKRIDGKIAGMPVKSIEIKEYVRYQPERFTRQSSLSSKLRAFVCRHLES